MDHGWCCPGQGIMRGNGTQDSKKYADTTSFVVTAVTTSLVVTVLLLQSFGYGQISRNVTARVVVTLRPSWS